MSKPENQDTSKEAEVTKGEESSLPKAEGSSSEKKSGSHLPSLREVRQHVPLGPGNFWNNMLSTVMLLVFVALAFSYLAENKVTPEELSISEVVT